MTFLDSKLLSVDSGFQLLGFLILVNETWIPDSLSFTPDSKAQDSKFSNKKKKIPGSLVPDYPTWGDKRAVWSDSSREC